MIESEELEKALAVAQIENLRHVAECALKTLRGKIQQLLAEERELARMSLGPHTLDETEALYEKSWQIRCDLQMNQAEERVWHSVYERIR